MARGCQSRGVAVLLALVALAAVGVMSLTALALARGERSAGLASLARVQARGAAEAALAQAMAGWPSAFTPLAPGDSSLLATVTAPGPAWGSSYVLGLGGPVFAIRAAGVRLSASGEELGAVRVELLVLLAPPDSLGVTRPRSYPRCRRVLP